MGDFLIVVLFFSMLMCPCVVALRSARAESVEEDGLPADEAVKAAPAMRS
jgi:hypothetical protein